MQSAKALPPVLTGGKAFATCFSAFADCFWQSAMGGIPVVMVW
jgi:hypothetical protein